MVCAKADLQIASAYVRQLGGDEALLAQLDAEFDRTVDAILRIRESTQLLADNPVLQSAIQLRNPYVDPLSLIQISLMRRKRDLDAHGKKDHPAIDAVLATTLSGIAQGLRNTG
jgi:phosphoenolpyruvate carboxylase